MGFALDHKQSRALSCSSCDSRLMKLRNCNNKFGKSGSPILLNGNVYEQCPRSIVVNEWELGYLVNLYFDCKETKKYPHAETLLNVTAFCLNVFNFMDGIVDAFKEKENAKMKEKMKKQNAKGGGNGN